MPATNSSASGNATSGNVPGCRGVTRRPPVALTLLFLVGGLFGWLLRGDGASADQPLTPTTVAAAVPPAPPETVIRTKTSVPEACREAAELGDEVIARLTRNQRDNRLFLALRKYTIASQACRREASP